MKIKEIIAATEAELVFGEHRIEDEVHKAFSSDLMSDVLTIDDDHLMLITGLANTQVLRTAEMADIHYVLLVRNKKATPEMVQLAKENEIVLMQSAYSMFRASGVLYQAGLNPVY